MNRPSWRRLVLVLVNFFPAGAGLVWLGRYRIGFSLMLAQTLFPFAQWLLPPSRNNEILLGVLLVALAVAVFAIFLFWSTVCLWRHSRFVTKPFPQRWHWPYWLALALFIAIGLLTSEAQFRPIRSFYFPADSMLPTLIGSDRAWADMRQPGQVRRGDVVIYTTDHGEFVSRVVGVGGDRVAVKGGSVVLNGVVVPQMTVSTTADERRATERPAGAPAHDIIDKGPSAQDEFREVRVPADRVFLLGDNRDNALDSRFGPDMDGPGMVPLDRVIGRLFLIYWSDDRARIGRIVAGGE